LCGGPIFFLWTTVGETLTKSKKNKLKKVLETLLSSTKTLYGKVRVMVFNSTFNNISVISSVLLIEETGVPGEDHIPAASH
jgi:hypothetical protein